MRVINTAIVLFCAFDLTHSSVGLHRTPGVECLELGSRGSALISISFIYYQRLCFTLGYLRKKVGDKCSTAKFLSSVKHSWVALAVGSDCQLDGVWNPLGDILLGKPMKAFPESFSLGKEIHPEWDHGLGPQQEERRKSTEYWHPSLSLLLTDVICLANGNFNWWEFRRALLSSIPVGSLDYWELAKSTQEDYEENSSCSLYTFSQFQSICGMQQISKWTVAPGGWVPLRSL